MVRFWLWVQKGALLPQLWGQFSTPANVLTSLASSSMVNLVDCTRLRLFRKSISALAAILAIFSSLPSYLDTFLRDGLTLRKYGKRGKMVTSFVDEPSFFCWNTYNLPRRSFTWMFSSLMIKSFWRTSYSRSYLLSSSLAMRAWYSRQMLSSLSVMGDL